MHWAAPSPSLPKEWTYSSMGGDPIQPQRVHQRSACHGNHAAAGIEFRYVLTMHLASHGPASITELADEVAWHGFAVAERVSKSISDALRWEMGYGRGASTE